MRITLSINTGIDTSGKTITGWVDAPHREWVVQSFVDFFKLFHKETNKSTAFKLPSIRCVVYPPN